jgi:hypothetical protein
LISTNRITVYKKDTTSFSSIWPGDANDDKAVDMYDPLAVAIAFNYTGSKRLSTSTAWTEQYCTKWNTTFINGVNCNHADCNGNGKIDQYDLYAISANYRPANTYTPTTQNPVADEPSLYFDLSNLTFTPGSTVTIPLKLYNDGAPLQNVYGIASNITINGLTLADPVRLSYENSWLVSTPDTLSFTKTRNNNTVDWALARTDHNNTSGQGVIANITFTIPNDAANDQPVFFSLSGTRLIDKDGNILTGYNVLSDTAHINTASVPNAAGNYREPVIVPNPSAINAKLVFAFPSTGILHMNICDIMGKTISTHEIEYTSGQHSFALPVTEPGVYFINLRDDTRSYRKSIRWVQY